MRLFRSASPAPAAWNIAKTIAALVIVWFVFLFLLPLGISILEVDFGIQRFPPQHPWAGALLLASTLFSIWAALTVAIAGHGTPLPFDAARQMVVGGPYAYLRYPLVLGVTGQLVGLGVGLGSVPVLMYGAVAFVVWYYLIRPAAEQAEARRFGREWHAYVSAVRAFRPRLTPYRPRH